MSASDQPFRIPKMTLHKGRGLARVRLNGRDVYLGRWGSPEAQVAYDRLVAEWLANGRILGPKRRGGTTDGPLVAELILGYANDIRPRLAPRVWAGTVRPALRRLRWLYGDLPAAELSPAKFRAFLRWCADGCGGKAEPLSRNYVNAKIAPRVRAVFKWAMERELVNASVWHALSGVSGLNTNEAPSRPKVQPVSLAVVNATLPHLPEVVASMVQLQRLTGMRPGEVCAMKWAEIDRTGEVWLYRPRKHKTAHHGHERVVPLGPRAQAVLMRYLDRGDDQPLFSPTESEASRKAQRRLARKTKVQPSQVDRRLAKPAKRPGQQYTPTSYARAVARAARAAFRPDAMSDEEFKAWKCPQHWHPNQLRHTRATEIRKDFGLDGAGAVLGHTKLETTQVYAERNVMLAAKIALATG